MEKYHVSGKMGYCSISIFLFFSFKGDENGYKNAPYAAALESQLKSMGFLHFSNFPFSALLFFPTFRFPVSPSLLCSSFPLFVSYSKLWNFRPRFLK